METSTEKLTEATFLCVQCKANHVNVELGRCTSCMTAHEALCKELDAKPHQKIEKAPVEWIIRTQVKNGVTVRTYTRADEMAFMNSKRIKLN